MEAIASCAYYSPDAYEGSEAGLIYSVYPDAFANTGATGGSSESLPDDVLPRRHDTIFVPSGFWLQTSGFGHTLAFPLKDEVRLRIGKNWYSIVKITGNFNPAAEVYAYSSLFASMQISEMGREVLELISAAPSQPYVDALSNTISFYNTAKLIRLGPSQ